MIGRLISCLVCLVALLIPVQWVAAEVPSGHYEIYYDYGTAALWDISGTYHEEDELGAESNFTLVQDDKGKVTGQGWATTSEPGLYIHFDYTLSGSVRGADNLTTVNLSVKGTGTASDGYSTLPVTSNMKLTLVIDNASRQLIGTVKGKVCVKGFGCDAIDDTADFEIPVEEDGSWELVLDIQNVDGKRLTGTGTALLSNGRAVPLAVSGKYASTSDVAKLKLKGNGSKMTLQGSAVPGLLIIQTMNGKILGQTLRQ